MRYHRPRLFQKGRLPVFLFSIFYFIIPFTPAAQENDLFGTKDRIPIGFSGKVYTIPDTTTRLPDLDKLKPMVHIFTKELNIPVRNFKEGFPGVPELNTWFAIQYEGHFRPKKEGIYNFRLNSDDGSKLFIDGALVINNDGVHGDYSATGKMFLSARNHYIKVQYFQGPPNHVALQLFGNFEGEKEVIFPGDYFSLSPPGNSNGKMVPFLAMLIPALISIALNFIPVVGTYKGIVEGVTGKDMITSDELSAFERSLGLLPIAGGLIRLGALAHKADRAGDAVRTLVKTDKTIEAVRTTDKILETETNIAGLIKPVTGQPARQIIRESEQIEKIIGETKDTAKVLDKIAEDTEAGIKTADKITEGVAATAKEVPEISKGNKITGKTGDLKNEDAIKSALEKEIGRFREKTGINKEPKITGTRRKGGTVAAAKPEIEGFPGDFLSEGSPKSKLPYDKNRKLKIPKEEMEKIVQNNTRYKPWTKFGGAQNHAEQNLLGNLADKLDGVFKTKTEAKGTVYLHVDAPVCPNCLHGLNQQHDKSGIIDQFTKEFPNIKLVISNTENGEVLIVQNGNRLN